MKGWPSPSDCPTSTGARLYKTFPSVLFALYAYYYLISPRFFVTSLGEHIFEVNLFGNYYGERLPQKDTESWNSFPDDPRIKIF